MSNIKVKGERLKVKGLFYLLSILIFQFSFSSCNPEAKWETENVEIKIQVQTVSAAFIRCSFSTNKEAYYLIACEPAKKDLDPMSYQKQFMTLALDSANVEYLSWRHEQLLDGEFNIAPFASHMLQYGVTSHFFTNLRPNTDYWIYAFVVNPDKLEPAGKLFLETVTTKLVSVMDVHFEYRVRGYWDYIYPLNPDGKINNRFPYLTATQDSAYLTDYEGQTPEVYFSELFYAYAEFNRHEDIRYGVQVVENNGIDANVCFIEGHTYYTAIAAFDGVLGNNVIYKFTWTGEEYEAYFRDEDSIVSDGEDD